MRLLALSARLGPQEDMRVEQKRTIRRLLNLRWQGIVEVVRITSLPSSIRISVWASPDGTKPDDLLTATRDHRRPHRQRVSRSLDRCVFASAHQRT